VNREWKKRPITEMLKHGYAHISPDHCVYMRMIALGKSMVVIHVDDMLVVVSSRRW
jgi:hypothetical protein